MVGLVFLPQAISGLRDEIFLNLLSVSEKEEGDIGIIVNETETKNIPSVLS